MQVILLERIEKLGLMGDVVNVKPGFARNYLLPLKKAMRATKENIAVFETQRVHLEGQNLKQREEAQAVAKRMEGLTVVLLRQAGESGQLYGSVANRDVSTAVTAAGFSIDRRQVLLDTPIKTLGLFKTRVALHPEVVIEITVNVAQSEEEAQSQAAKAAPAPEPAAAAPADAAPAADESPSDAPKKKKAKAKAEDDAESAAAEPAAEPKKKAPKAKKDKE
jgi:large subunit ribosomal protein L9